MKRFALAALAALTLAACNQPPAAPAPEARREVSADAAHIVAAIADARRPQDDKDRDANRHPAETLAFAGIEPGDRVADLLPGGGYFTRLFAVAVGESGKIYPVIRPDGVAGEFENSDP